MELWLPGAKRVDAWQDGGSMTGGPPRVIWHSTENDPNKTSAYAIAQYLNRVGYQVHVVWNPVSGEIIQMIPADRAGRGVRHTDAMQTNRMGDVCVQIEVVAHAAHPFTSYGMLGLDQIMKWIRQLKVPDVWPGGPPPTYPDVKHVTDATWSGKAGHYSHSQVPQNDHNDPGAIDIRKLFGDDVSATDVWNFEVPAPWDTKNKTWRAQTVLSNTEAHLRTVETKVSDLETKVADLATKLDRVVKKLAA